MTLTLATACSGIGAPEVAAQQLGWTTAWCSEVAAFPSMVLAERHPSSVNLGDLEALARGQTSIPAGRVDVLAAGTPCQSFSVAGLRRGMADPRGNLALAFLGLVDRVRPPWVLWENVPGVLSSRGGRDFGSFLGGLAELGYGWAYRVLDAQHFGVPQRRHRVFVVGHLGGWAGPAAVLFDPESMRGNPPPGREARAEIAEPLGAGAPGSGWRDDPERAGAFIPEVAHALTRGDRMEGTAETFIAHTVKTRPGRTWEASAETYVTHALLAGGHDGSEDGSGRGTPLVADTLLAGPDGHSPPPPGRGMPIIPIQSANRVRERKQNGMGIGAPGDPMFTLDSRSDHAVAFDLAQVTSSENRSNPQPGGPAPTANSTSAGRIAVAFSNTAGNTALGLSLPGVPPVTARNGDPGSVLLPTGGVRRLTPLECERLQAFPDGYTSIPVARVRRQRLHSPRAGEAYVERNGEVWRLASDAARYQALGNSMAVCVIRWIFQRLEVADRAIRGCER